MNKIYSLATLAFMAIIMAFSSVDASAQITITRSTSKSDSLQFARETSNNHPGGWNFDIIGHVVSTKKTSSNQSSPDWSFFGGFGFGFTTALNADPSVSLKMGRSFNFCIADIVSCGIRPWRNGKLSVGYGIDLHNYTLSSNLRFVEDPVSKQISVVDPTTVTDYSRIHTLAAATFNLKYIHTLGRGFRVAIGPELYILGRKHDIRNCYIDENGVEQKERLKNIRTNKVGFNLVGIVNYKSTLGIYAKYSPTNVIEPGFGPKFQTLSVGVMVCGL